MKRRTSKAIFLMQKRLFVIVAVMLVTFSGLYGYFVSKSIINVLVREEMEQEVASLNSKLSELEFTYITKKEQIDLTFAQSLGFERLEGKHYVPRRSVLSGGLTLDDTPR